MDAARRQRVRSRQGDPDSDDAFARGADDRPASESDAIAAVSTEPVAEPRAAARRAAGPVSAARRRVRQLSASARRRSAQEAQRARAGRSRASSSSTRSTTSRASRTSIPRRSTRRRVVQGVEMVEKKLLKALGGAGLEIINPVDQTFDPALHEAVATEPALSPEDDHVVVARLSARLPVQRPAAAPRARRREAVERLST